MESDEQWPPQADVLKLKTEISRTHEAVTTLASRRFRFYLCKLATEQGVPLDCDTVNDLCGEFREEAAGAGKSVIVKKKLCVCQNIFKENLPAAQAVRRASSHMKAAPHCFGCELEKAFIRHSGPFFTSRSKDAAKTKLVKRAGAIFSKDIAQRAADHFHKLNTTLLDFYGKHHKNMGNIPLPGELFVPRPPYRADHTPTARVCKPPRYRIVDPFGRGLLHPLDLRYRIAEINDDLPPGAIRFPRKYCGPILDVLKTLIFGQEKYVRINAKFLKSMTDFCGTDHPERSLLKKFYRDEQVVQFLARFVLYILMSLDSETRRMFFIRKINKIMDATGKKEVEPFTTAHLGMLLKAWLAYADQHRQYLPEKTVNKITASIHTNAMAV
jgi:hypothetical protein